MIYNSDEWFLIYRLADKPRDNTFHYIAIYHGRDNVHAAMRTYGWTRVMDLSEARAKLSELLTVFEETRREDVWKQWKQKTQSPIFVAGCGPEENEFFGGLFTVELLAKNRIEKAGGGRVYYGRSNGQTVVNVHVPCPFDDRVWL